MAEKVHVLTFLLVAIVGIFGLFFMINDRTVSGLVTGAVQNNAPCYGYLGQKACGTFDDFVYECSKSSSVGGFFTRVSLPLVWQKIQDCSPGICRNNHCISAQTTVGPLTPTYQPPQTQPITTPTGTIGPPVPGGALPPQPQICVDGRRRCSGTNVEICSANAWYLSQICPPESPCSNGACTYTAPAGFPGISEPLPEPIPGEPEPEPETGVTPECMTGEKKCKDANTAMICDENAWKTIPCENSQTCFNGVCADWTLI